MSGHNITGSFPNTPPTTAIKTRRHLDAERLSVASSLSNTRAENTPLESEFDSATPMASQEKGKAPMRFDIGSTSRQQEDDLESVAARSDISATESHIEVPGAPVKRRPGRPPKNKPPPTPDTSFDLAGFVKAIQQQQQQFMLQQSRDKEIREQQFLQELARQKEKIRELETQNLTAGSARENTPAFSVPTYQAYRDNDRVTMEIKNLRKEAKLLLPDKPLVTLKSDNFQAWKSNILSEADLIQAKNILEEEQMTAPIEYDELEESLWKERKRILYIRIVTSLHFTKRKVVNGLRANCPVSLWQALNAEYGVSTVKIPNEPTVTRRY